MDKAGIYMASSENICKFASATESSGEIFAYQYIYETAPAKLGEERSYTAFVCHLVMEGSAEFTYSGGSYHLQPGDIFFAFPMLSFRLQPDPDFKYCYISFIGAHASDLLESLGVTREDPVRIGHGFLRDLWFSGLSRSNSDNLTFLAKGVLYYTFACLKKADPVYKKAVDCNSVVAQIRDAVEQDFSNPELSLERLCRSFGYNAKYICRKFRQIVGVGFSDYLVSCRIRHACILLAETGMTIREVSTAVGYPDALYFSKVFKKIMKVSPSEHRSEVRQ